MRLNGTRHKGYARVRGEESENGAAIGRLSEGDARIEPTWTSADEPSRPEAVRKLGKQNIPRISSTASSRTKFTKGSQPFRMPRTAQKPQIHKNKNGKWLRGRDGPVRYSGSVVSAFCVCTQTALYQKEQ